MTNVEVSVVTRRFESYTLSLNIYAHRECPGNESVVLGVNVVGLDISDLKIAEVELTIMSQDSRALIDKTDTPLICVDRDGIVNVWNEKAAQLLDYSTVEAVGCNLLQEFIPPDRIGAVRQVQIVFIMIFSHAYVFFS